MSTYDALIDTIEYVTDALENVINSIVAIDLKGFSDNRSFNTY